MIGLDVLSENRKLSVASPVLYQRHCECRSWHLLGPCYSMFGVHAYLSHSQQLCKPESYSIAASCSKFCEHFGLHQSLPSSTFLKGKLHQALPFSIFLRRQTCCRDLSLRYAFVHAKSAKVSPKHMSMRSGRPFGAGLLWQAAPASSLVPGEFRVATSAKL